MDNQNQNNKNGYTLTPNGDYFEHETPVSATVKNEDEPTFAAKPSPAVSVESAPQETASENTQTAPAENSDTVSTVSPSVSENAAKGEEPKVEEPKPEPKPVYAPAYTTVNPHAQPRQTYAPNGRYSYMPPQYQNGKNKNKKYSAGLVILSAVCAAIIGAMAASGCFIALNSFGLSDVSLPQTSDSQSADTTAPQKITIDGNASNVAQAVAAKCTQSIVSVRTTYSVTSFFGGSQEAAGEGSGVIYSADGYIITNHHVIAEALETQNSKVEVFFAGNTKTAVSATIVGYNISTDLAVLKVNKTGLPAAELGSSANLKLGANAVVIGNPGGMEFMNSVSAGVISGLDRSVATESGATMTLIQTDAAINPGNSGGGLFDQNGKLIGITNSKLVSTQIEGIGFAIPVDSVKDICGKIIARKDQASPYVGIEVSQRYTADTLKQLGYPAGAVVNSVATGSPAETGGIRRGDIITEFNGTAINNYTELADAIKDCKVGATVTVKLYRSGRYYSTSLKVEANNAVSN
ncbi:MAG: trypsin-like peptidase domain-containing protein [Oscillospiraceae bacterium]|nr:trypsin-like peptidase domain-containing protein [Candidatus Equicaccousia limihippi]